MTKKRTTLKDKDIFRRTKALEEFSGSSSQVEQEEETMAQERTEGQQSDASESVAGADDLAGLAAEAELATGASSSSGAMNDLPVGEAALDLSASLNAEAAAATIDDDNLGLPAALETPPGEANLGDNDVDLGAMDSADFSNLVEADLNLPAAMDASPDDVDLGFPSAIETPEATFAGPVDAEPTTDLDSTSLAGFDANLTLPDFPAASATDLPPALETPPFDANTTLPDFPAASAVDLPAAMETPPLDAVSASMSDPGSTPAADLPIGEAGFGDIPDAPVGEAGLADGGALPAGEAGFELPTALPVGEAGLDQPSSLPMGEAGFEPQTTFSTIPSGTPSPFESAAPTPLDTPASFSSRPTPPPETTPSLPVPPQTSGGTFAVSRTTPLTLDDDSPRDIFDFMGVADEPKTITYQIPEDIEELTLEERKRRMMLLKDTRIRDQFEKIYEAIEAEYQHLLDSNISSNKEITDWSQNLLAETRYILMNYQIEHLAKAEWNIQQVKARIDRAEESEKWRQKWGWLIIIWGVVWFFIFVIMIFNPDPLLFVLQSSSSLSYLVPTIFLRTLFFGGIGGVTSVFYSLLNYVSTRQYDKEYNFSYFTKPFMGMIIGTLVYLMLYVVAPIFNIVPQGIDSATGEPSSTFEVLTYFVAIAAGFKENVAFALLSRLMKLVFRDERPQDAKTPEATPPPGPFSPA